MTYAIPLLLSLTNVPRPPTYLITNFILSSIELCYQKKRTFSQLRSVAISGPELATPAYQWKKTAFGRRVVSDEDADYRLHHQNPLAQPAEVPQPLIVEKKETEERTKLLENILEVDILYACLDSNE
jgi:hypothetical protein